MRLGVLNMLGSSAINRIKINTQRLQLRICSRRLPHAIRCGSSANLSPIPIFVPPTYTAWLLSGMTLYERLSCVKA